MERRNRHRILVMVVFIAIVIILLPFFLGNKEIPGENALITSPPFPDQPAEVSLGNTTTTELQLPEQEIKRHDDLPVSSQEPSKASKYRIIEATEIGSKISLKTPADDGLKNLSRPVWVVHMGSFKKKTNALQLVNNLRASGYHAFIQDIGMTPRETTRVYVGPEQNRAKAIMLAYHLQNDTHMKGVIISYKPLVL